jgi:hypothetical protein
LVDRSRYRQRSTPRPESSPRQTGRRRPAASDVTFREGGDGSCPSALCSHGRDRRRATSSKLPSALHRLRHFLSPAETSALKRTPAARAPLTDAVAARRRALDRNAYRRHFPLPGSAEMMAGKRRCALARLANLLYRRRGRWLVGNGGTARAASALFSGSALLALSRTGQQRPVGGSRLCRWPSVAPDQERVFMPACCR